jgi:hypothetical protein
VRSNNSPLCLEGCDDPASCEHVCLLGHEGHPPGFLLDCSPHEPVMRRLIETEDGRVIFEPPPEPPPAS